MRDKSARAIKQIEEICRENGLTMDNLAGAIIDNGVRPVLSKEIFFYKVVSARAGHVGEVECITFSQIPHISFRAERHLLWQPSDGIVGHYSYSGIHNCSVSKHKIEGLIEITKEEFETAARKHLNMLFESEWQAIADPYIVRSFDNE